MIVAAIAALGALLDLQSLQQTLPPGIDAAVSEALSSVDIGEGASGARTLSIQELSGVSSGLDLRIEGPATFRTGDILITGGSGNSSFTGIQSVSFNTGVASVVQSSVSVAAGSFQLGAAP
ncbi:hypothetical protein [Phenylobacterium sp.]|uniref:hypothetical protein n=1 Tax=Phenylobacterium sp. TaxID=1871053 RepID=UPI002732579B|nr:hypothetical protein [Phenylobacterium sp.]MDP3659343.1 hypothetical protein [Phenylobacterium sp.]